MSAIAILTLSLVLGAPVGKEKAETPKIEGEWIVEKYVQGGSENEKRKGMHFTFADGKAIVKEEGADIGYTVDAKKDPATIDLIAGAKENILGIYKIEGDTLTICFPKGGRAERPTKFESPEGSSIVVMTLKREKKK